MPNVHDRDPSRAAPDDRPEPAPQRGIGPPRFLGPLFITLLVMVSLVVAGVLMQPPRHHGYGRTIKDSAQLRCISAALFTFSQNQGREGSEPAPPGEH